MKPVSTGCVTPSTVASTVWVCPPSRRCDSKRVTACRRASSQADARPAMPAPTTAIRAIDAGQSLFVVLEPTYAPGTRSDAGGKELAAAHRRDGAGQHHGTARSPAGRATDGLQAHRERHGAAH